MAADQRAAKRATYVETHAGWRAFFLCVLLAAVLGCGFRLYFSSARLKAWVTRALDQQKATMAHPFAASIGDASLRLSDSSGYFPQLAVVVTDVRIAPKPECYPEASILIGELRLPFRVRDLIKGRASIGLVSAKDLKIDLDGLRANCESSVSAASPSPNVNVDVNENVDEATSNLPAPWWSPAQFATVHGFIEGFEFSRATLQFENKTKEIYLDSFSARLGSENDVDLRTEIRIPSQVSYGEQIPPLKITGHATNVKADLVIQARVSEGSMSTTATLTPEKAQGLRIEAVSSVKSLPLSMLSPLMRKSGLANAKFQPKFLWLDCDARIEGPFQGIFQKSPLMIENCRLEGDGTDIRLAKAVRAPNGSWKPFDVEVRSLNLAKLFETVGVKGPEGVASDFGKLHGQIHVESDHVADFKGELRNAQLQFSNRKVRAPQLIRSADVEIKLETEEIRARIANVALANGVFSGEAKLHLDRTLSKGSTQLEIAKLELDPVVQNVLVAGTLGPLEGSVHAQIDEARIKDFEAVIHIAETIGADFEFAKLDVKAGRRGEEPPRIAIDAPSFELKRNLRNALEPAFFAHRIDKMKLDSAHIELFVLGAGDLEWSKARATIERGKIEISSNGSMDRDHIVNGTVTVNYPRIKNLKWSVKGAVDAPVLKDNSDELKQLRARAEINDQVLGL